MKEIDFIPDWYKANCRRRRRYVRQYSLMGVLFAATMLWSFMMGQYIQHAGAQVQEVETALLKKTQWIDEAALLQQEIAIMESRKTLLEDITPRTPMSAIVGELSYLIPNDVVLTNLSLTADVLQKKPSKGAVHSVAVVQVDTNSKDSEISEVAGLPSRMKIILSGIAAKPANAAGLISRLEHSHYFEEVDLVFSKPKKIKTYTVTEFEISCYVADYKIVE